MKKLLFILFTLFSLVGFSQYRIGNDLLIMKNSDSLLIDIDYDADTIEFNATKKIKIDSLVGVPGLVSFGSENQIPSVNATTNDFDYSANHTFDGSELKVDGSAIFNESGADKDFRIEGVSAANALFVQGSDGNVGIGTSSPDELLEISKDDKTNGAVFRITNDAEVSGAWNAGDIIGDIDFYSTDAVNITSRIRSVVENQLANRNMPEEIGLSFSTYQSSTLSEVMRIMYNGNVGIGTTNPDFKLQVAGDIAPEDDALHNLGSNTKAWDTIFSKTFLVNQNDSYSVTNGYLFGSDGNSGFYENSSTQVYYKSNGIIRFRLGTSIMGNSGAAPAFQDINTTFTKPSLNPNRTDLNTGIGWVHPDNLSLIAGGKSMMQLDENGGATDSITFFANFIPGGSHDLGSYTNVVDSLYVDDILASSNVEGDTAFFDVFTNHSDCVIGESGSDVTFNADTVTVSGVLISGSENAGNLLKNQTSQSIWSNTTGTASVLEDGGINNIILGQYSGTDLTTGDYNITIGYTSGTDLTTGGYNILIGASSGYTLTDGVDNIFIGKSSGYSETGSNKLYIENSNSASPLIYGEFDNDYLKFNADSAEVTGNFTSDPMLSCYAFKDKSQAITITAADTWYVVTDGSGTLFTSKAAEDFTNAGDSIVATDYCDYASVFWFVSLDFPTTDIFKGSVRKISGTDTTYIGCSSIQGRDVQQINDMSSFCITDVAIGDYFHLVIQSNDVDNPTAICGRMTIIKEF